MTTQHAASNDHPLSHLRFSFVDVETTGLSAAQGHRICEIAVLAWIPGNEPAIWHTLIHPERAIPAEVSAIHRITDTMVVAAPHFKDIISHIQALVDDTILVCHNTPFDYSFIQSEFSRAHQTLCCRQHIDTLQLARRYFSFGSNRLENVARCLGVPAVGYHRAQADVYATYHIFTQMVPRILQGGVEFDALLSPLESK